MVFSSHNTQLVGTSLFSSAGIAEQYFSDVGIDIVAANELLPERAELYQSQYPNSKMICGNILNKDVFQSLIDVTPEKLDFLIASPPCHGMSVTSKNRTTEQMLADERNFLVFKIYRIYKNKKSRFYFN